MIAQRTVSEYAYPVVGEQLAAMYRNSGRT
jgi:hypothetical protein